jgi:hypothetical protein
MVVNDLDIIGLALSPDEADAPSIIDPDAVLTFSISRKPPQPVAGWRPEIRENFGGIQNG